MRKAEALRRLRAREVELRAMGVARLSLFGSTARGDQHDASDVDIAAMFDPGARVGLFRYAEIAEFLEQVLGVPIDLVGEPARKKRMQTEIDRDRVSVF